METKTKITMKEQQRQEAIERLKLLKLYPNVLKDFEKESLVNVSEHGGILFWVNDEQKQMIEEFEQKHNALVYHVIHNYTSIGEMYSLLYVSKYKTEWKRDKKELQEGYPCVYVKNVDDDWSSEFGTIGIKEQFGGLIRTA